MITTHISLKYTIHYNILNLINQEAEFCLGTGFNLNWRISQEEEFCLMLSYLVLKEGIHLFMKKPSLSFKSNTFEP